MIVLNLKYYSRLRNPWLFMLIMLAVFAAANHSAVWSVFAFVPIFPVIVYQIQVI